MKKKVHQAGLKAIQIQPIKLLIKVCNKYSFLYHPSYQCHLLKIILTSHILLSEFYLPETKSFEINLFCSLYLWQNVITYITVNDRISPQFRIAPPPPLD